MPIRKQLPGFWWYREGRIAGMARPGFNRDWGDLELEPGVVLSFVGKLAGSRGSERELREHVDWYRRMVCIFQDTPPEELDERTAAIAEPGRFVAELERVNASWGVLRDFQWIEEKGERVLEVEFDDERPRREVALLQEHGIRTLVSLVEQPPDACVRESDLEVHHIPVPDMNPPLHEQVEAFREILERCERDARALVVHCLAGIGRTATMLMAGHLARGHALADVVEEVRTQNPRYGFRGGQWAFLQEFAAKVAEEAGQEEA